MSHDLVVSAKFYGQPVRFLEKRCYTISSSFFSSRAVLRYSTDILKGTLFPPMFAHSRSTDSRKDAEPTSVLSVFQLKHVAIHTEQNINTCLNTGLKGNKLIRWCTFGQLSVIGVLVIFTTVDRNLKKKRKKRGVLQWTTFEQASIENEKCSA